MHKLNFFLVLAVALILAAALVAQDTDEIYKVGNGVTQPRIKSKKDPDYPPEAREARIQGMVTLECVVRRDGTVTDLKVVEGPGHGPIGSASKKKHGTEADGSSSPAR